MCSLVESCVTHYTRFHKTLQDAKLSLSTLQDAKFSLSVSCCFCCLFNPQKKNECNPVFRGQMSKRRKGGLCRNRQLKSSELKPPGILGDNEVCTYVCKYMYIRRDLYVARSEVNPSSLAPPHRCWYSLCLQKYFLFFASLLLSNRIDQQMHLQRLYTHTHHTHTHTHTHTSRDTFIRSLLQRVAVCVSALQRVAVRCSVSQCIAARHFLPILRSTPRDPQAQQSRAQSPW